MSVEPPFSSKETEVGFEKSKIGANVPRFYFKKYGCFQK